VTAAAALIRRAAACGRVSTVAYGLIFLVIGVIQPVAYRRTYPTTADRLQFAASFGSDKVTRIFYGTPYDLLSVEGYTAWRVGGILVILAALWAVLATTRALRGEEDAGRYEIVLAGVVGRATAYVASLLAIVLGGVVLWGALLAGLLLGGLRVGGSAYMALAVVSAVPVFAGLGALASQLAATRRLANAMGVGALVAALLLRVAGDTSTSLRPLRWATPLGWVEEMRPFTGTRPLVLLLPAGISIVLLAAAGAIALRRDVGSALLGPRDARAARTRLLGSPVAQALRSERGLLAGWAVGIGAFAVLFGIVSAGVAEGIPAGLRERLERLGLADIATPSGYLGLTFLFFVLALSLFVVAQIAAARHEETAQRLETLLALPVGRRGWLTGRMLLACAVAAALALLAGLLAWAGAASQDAGVSLGDMVAAGANCLPAVLLFLGLASLGFAVAPRASIGIAYGLVIVTFLWELVGPVLGAPGWTLAASPFHHVGLVPAQSFRAGAAAAMTAIGAAAAAVAVVLIDRRDIVGA
jgi:ABC-2 type transport system permease protein